MTTLDAEVTSRVCKGVHDVAIFATKVLGFLGFFCMRISCRFIVALTTALALAGIAAAAPPQNRFAAKTNFTKAHRSESAIRFIVIHVSEGSFPGTVAWLEDPRAHSSANFVVGREGEVQQLVPLHDIAWHAGNWAYNVRSIGIENVGYTDDPAGFTTKEYRAAARIAAVIARRAVIPIDRHHIIGHSQVPDPNDPLQGGGIDGHTDPGKFWQWGRFMRLVERFAYPQRFVAHRHVGLQIEASTLSEQQVVAGKVPWRTTVGGPVEHVAVPGDGRVSVAERGRPFALAGGKVSGSPPVTGDAPVVTARQAECAALASAGPNGMSMLYFASSYGGAAAGDHRVSYVVPPPPPDLDVAQMDRDSVDFKTLTGPVFDA